MDTSERLPSATEVHDVRSGEVNVDPRAAVPASPHVQPEGLGRIELHLPSKWGRETKTTTRCRGGWCSLIRTHGVGPRGGPPSGEALLAEARSVRCPVPLFPEHHSDLGLTPSPFLSWSAPPS